jgi:RNA polymerase sigma-54 factor
VEMMLAAQQKQKLNLTTYMLRSLELLQLPAVELSEFIQEASLSNPLLEIEMTSAPLSLNAPPVKDDYTELCELSLWQEHGRAGSNDWLEQIPPYEETLTEYLCSQLRQTYLLSGDWLKRCLFIAESLDERGYLTTPIDVLAGKLGCTAAELEQALFDVQMLDPPGVAARDLTECLILQLAQGPNLNALTLRLAREGLPLLAAHRYEELAKRFRTDENTIRSAAKVIASLNPIPSGGYNSGQLTEYCIPDAVVETENGQITIKLNDSCILPRVAINRDYVALINETNDEETRQYLKGMLTEAKNLINSIDNRSHTITMILRALAEFQSGYFLRGEDLRPLTMQKLADILGINISTVSRAVQGKVIQFNGKSIPIRSFFTTAILSVSGDEISNEAAKQRIAYLIQRENADAPLSDEALRLVMADMGIRISRRTVAKYRAALGIPSAAQRKRIKNDP